MLKIHNEFVEIKSKSRANIKINRVQFLTKQIRKLLNDRNTNLYINI